MVEESVLGLWQELIEWRATRPKGFDPEGSASEATS